MFTAVLVFVAAAATAVLPPPGTHLVEHTTIYLTKLNKTSPVELYYPADYSTTPVSFPVVVLSHGKQEGQPDTEPVSMPFPELIEEIVSRGAIVIALQTCLAPKCHKAFFDQLAAIDACRRNRKLHPALHKANFKNVALVGHGIGGQHTERSARKIGFNIKAAVPMHTIPRVQWAKQAIVPTLYLTGTADVEAPAAMVRRAFAANSQPGSRIANLVGAAHDEPSHFAEGRMNRYVALFVRCHTVQDVEACQYVEAMCSAYNYEDCDAKVSIKIEEVGASKEKVQKSCPVCMAYFFVLLFFLFVCLFPSCTNERLFGK